MPPMAESMRGPLKIMPWPRRQHHFTRTMPILQREPHFHTPRTLHFCHTSRAGRRGAGGLGTWGPHSPLPLLSLSRCVAQTQDSLSRLYPHAHHAGPGGRRTSACGSCRRPLKYCENQGIEESNGAKKESQRAKTRVGRIHDSKEEKLRLASTRARKNENTAHT